jgi:hypothetical protein
MLTFSISSRTAWSDYFTGSPTIIQTKIYGTTQTPSDSNVYVSSCLFNKCNSTSNGGALSCSSSVIYLLVESTSFFSCKTSSSYGGAIYFENTNNGQCVLHGVCCYDCSSDHYGHFARIRVNNGALSKNYVNYSSIVRCVSEISGSNYMVYLYNGKICCPSVNISMNKNEYISGICCYPFVDSNSFTCSLLYSSFVDNLATVYGCFWLWTEGAKYEIKGCNILRNTQVDLNRGGTINTNGILMIEDSCILENEATNIFNQGTSLYTITLSNCTVDKTTCNQNLITQKTVIKSFIHGLNHMSTLNCHAEYDTVGTLTPITQTRSPSKNYCTRGNNLCQYQVIDFVSLLSVFLFKFIHVDASTYPLY